MSGANAAGERPEPSLLAIGRVGASSERTTEAVARNAHGLAVWAIAAGSAAFFVWAAHAEFDQVTRAPGNVVVAQQTQMIQHLEGGIVSEILIEEGDRVSAGDPLLRITDSRWIASQAQAALELRARRAARARLLAEAMGAESLAFPSELAGDASTEAEAALFAERRRELEAKLTVFREQSRRLVLELAELRGRQTNIEAQRALVAERAQILSGLVTRGAVSRSEELATLGELQQIDTRLSDIAFQIPQSEAELQEVRSRLREAESTFRTEARGRLTEVELEIAKLEADLASFEDRDTRSLVRSPVEGVVNRLLVATIGGVVRDGQPIAEIVPSSDEIVIHARLTPEDRGDVWPGMEAVLKITAYDFGSYGGVAARVVEISPDALRDENGTSYFRVKLAAKANALGDERPILPGMSVEVDMISGSRTFLEYLLAPVRLLEERAFME